MRLIHFFMNSWSLAVLIAGGITAAIFGRQFLRLLKYKKVGPQITPRGSEKKAAVYALTRGLLPREKESTRRHYWVYGAGVVYHSGIFSSFFWLASQVFSLSLPQTIRFLLAVVITVGGIAGLGLLGRRVFSRWLRNLSYPDDFAANLLVDFFLAGAVVSILERAAVPMFQAISILLILYLPLGKIRHCFLFFPSRVIFGRYFGQRGILPPLRGTREETR